MKVGMFDKSDEVKERLNIKSIKANLNKSAATESRSPPHTSVGVALLLRGAEATPYKNPPAGTEGQDRIKTPGKGG